jgi:hypothetical protein
MKVAGLKPLNNSGDLLDDPTRSVLILLGKTELLGEFDAVDFLRRGGAILIATDDVRQSHHVAATFGVMVPGLLPALRADPRGLYRRLRQCPFVQFSSPENWGNATIPGFRHVATNEPAFLSYSDLRNPLNLKIMGAFSTEYGTQIRIGNRILRLGSPPFAIGGRVGDGRVLILSDHSVFLNDMMLPRDNDNFEFAANVVEWLKEPREGNPRRDRVLYVEEGTIRTDFEVKWKQVLVPPLPPPEDLLELGDRLVSGLEKEGYFRDLEERNVFNDTLDTEFGLGNILRGIALTLTLGLLLYGGFRLVRGRQRFENAPLFALALARATPEGMAVEQRQQALLKQRNLWEPASDLARQCLEPLAHGTTRRGATLPPMVAQGNWWQRRQWRRRIERLWQLAYGRRPVPVSAREFTRLLEQAEEIKAALHNGTVQLAEPIGNRRPS